MGPTNGLDLVEKSRKLEQDLIEKCNQNIALQTSYENLKAMYESNNNTSSGAGGEKKESLSDALRLLVREKSQCVNLQRKLDKEKNDRQTAERALEKERNERAQLQAKHQNQQQQLQLQYMEQQQQQRKEKHEKLEELELKVEESSKYSTLLQTAMQTLVESNKRLLEEKKRLEEDLQLARDKHLALNVHIWAKDQFFLSTPNTTHNPQAPQYSYDT